MSARAAGPKAAARPGSSARTAGAMPPAAAGPPLSAGHPAMIAAIVVAAACALVSVTFKLYDTDFWHHLLVGRVIWETRSVPMTQLWSWPTYGAPEANSAWAFRALVWPFWSLGDVGGLFVWRWLTTLAAFAVLWATARRMGARGFAPLVALVLCVFIYRLRSQIRPETLVAVLAALEIWILETRRRGGRDRSVWLVLIAWIWANAHVSYYLGFVILGVYLLESWLVGRRARGRSAAGSAIPGVRRLALVALAALAISFVNPFGWRALWQPFDFFLHLRHELMYRTIFELKPVDWRRYWTSALPVLVGGWIALIAWRATRRAFDRVEVLFCLAFTALSLSTQRFLGFYALVATPFLMRDTGEWVSARRWPNWTRSPLTRAAVTAAVCLAMSIPEWRRPDLPLGIGFQWERYPVKACDFIAANGIRGRGFNNFEFGGYQAWRFWPDRTRLPFMTGTIEAATPMDRLLYAGTFARPDAWRALDRRHRFDYILLLRKQEGDNRLLDVLDADTTWALVFADDAATIYLRRSGPLAPIAARLGARPLPAGGAGLAALGRAMAADTTMVEWVAEGLRARAAASPMNSRDLALLANVELARGRLGDARRLLEQALAVDPLTDRGHMLLGMIALAEDRPREAVTEFERQRAISPRMAGVAIRLGQAWHRLGDLGRARAAYRRELAIDPGNREALDSLGVIGGRLGD
jgi:tetratricopeptide repeat protein